MRKKYRVVYEYTAMDEEGNDLDYTNQAVKYLDNYGKHEDFLQLLDMAGDENTHVLQDESISYIKSGFYVLIARIIYLLRGYMFRTGRNLFYHFIDKALIPTVNDPLCIAFDDKAFKYIRL